MLLALLFPSSALAATWQVNGEGGVDFLTIQSAIVAASDGDEIRVAPGIYAENIDFLGKAVTVQSVDGSALTSIEGAGGSGAFVTFGSGEGAESILRGFTLRGSGLVGGRGISIDHASPTLVELVFISLGSAELDGGAVVVRGGAPSFESCVFMANTGALGGDLHVTGGAEVTITGSAFSLSAAERGGSIYVASGGLSVGDSSFLDSSAVSGGGAIYTGSGTSLALANTSVTSASIGTGNGGGIEADNASLSLDHVTFSDNQSMTLGASDRGGAVSMDGGTLTANDSEFLGNLSGAGGGLSLRSAVSATLERGRFAGNVAYGSGGGISVIDGSLSLAGTDFAGNLATVAGGGVYAYGDLTFVLRAGLFQANRADGTSGGALSLAVTEPIEIAGTIFWDDSAAQDGGAIDVDGLEQTLAIRDARFLNHRADAGDGGAVHVSGDGGAITMTDVQMNNAAAFRDGGAIFSTGVSLLLEGTECSGNDATGGDGGTIYVRGTRVREVNLVLAGVEVLSGQAGNGGGGVYAYSMADITISGSKFRANNARTGGGLYLEHNDVVSIHDNMFAFNEVQKGAAGYSIGSTTSTWEHNVFLGNTAEGEGGGAYFENEPDLRMRNNDFLANNAESGGGVMLDDSAAEFVNNILAYSLGGPAVGADDNSLDWSRFAYCAWFKNTPNADTALTALLAAETSNLIGIDPMFVSWGGEVDSDLRLRGGSELIDAGDSLLFDPDGSRSDIGAFVSNTPDPPTETPDPVDGPKKEAESAGCGCSSTGALATVLLLGGVRVRRKRRV